MSPFVCYVKCAMIHVSLLRSKLGTNGNWRLHHIALAYGWKVDLLCSPSKKCLLLSFHEPCSMYMSTHNYKPYRSKVKLSWHLHPLTTFWPRVTFRTYQWRKQIQRKMKDWVQIHQPEGKFRRRCSPSHHTISAHIPCEHTACINTNNST